MYSLDLKNLFRYYFAKLATEQLILVWQVGVMMMGESGHIDWTSMPVAVPAFLTMVVQPFTFSIANGIYAGLLSSFLLFILTGDFVTYFRGISKGDNTKSLQVLEIS